MLSPRETGAGSQQPGRQVLLPRVPTHDSLSGQAYERGISLFKWPNVSDIWSTYLTKFIARYGGRKLERARDLFEQALDGCPPKYAKSEAGRAGGGGGRRGRAPASDRRPSGAALYLLYAQLEEEWGLARHAMAVYERATRAVEPAQRYDMFNIYIKRAAEIYGVTHTRGIYQKAIEVPHRAGGGGWGTRGRVPEAGPGRGNPADAHPFPPPPRRCCRTSTPGRCACGSRTWSAGSARSTGRALSTASAPRSVTPG